MAIILSFFKEDGNQLTTTHTEAWLKTHRQSNNTVIQFLPRTKFIDLHRKWVRILNDLQYPGYHNIDLYSIRLGHYYFSARTNQKKCWYQNNFHICIQYKIRKMFLKKKTHHTNKFAFAILSIHETVSDNMNILWVQNIPF